MGFARLLAVAAAAMFALAACDDIANLSEDELLQRAIQQRTAGELPTSVITLKSLVQKNPQNATARYWLGVSYVDMGDGASAEKELVAARSFKFDSRTLLKPLGEALLMQSKFEDAIKEAEDARGAPGAADLVLSGKALAGLGRIEEAKQTLDRAIAAAPKSLDALVARARISLGERKIDETKSLLDKATAAAASPDTPDLVALTGDTAFLAGDAAGALEAYTRLKALQKHSLLPRLSVARAQIVLGKSAEAIAELEPVIKRVPNDPRVNYLRALAAYNLKDYQSALSYSERVLNRYREDLPSALLAGASNYALGQMEQANRQLSSVVSRVPGHEGVRRLLAATQLRLNRPADAVATLEPVVQRNSEDANLLQLVGSAAMQAGNMQAASRYFQRAIEQRPDDARLRARLGVTKIALGKLDEGIEVLEDAVEMDPALEHAEAALLMAHWRAKEYDKLLRAALDYQRKHPDKPLGFTAEGLALAGQKKPEEARAAFERALKAAPGDLMASGNAATLAMQARDYDRARSYLVEANKHHPASLRTLLQLSRIESLVGDRAAMQKWLERAVETKPDAGMPRLLLGRLYFTGGELAKAVAALTPALAEHPDEASVLEVLGRSYLGLKQPADAVRVLERLARARPNVAEAHYLLGSAYEAADNPGAQRAALAQALKLDPAHGSAKLSLARMELQQRNLEPARKLVGELRATSADDPAVRLIGGDLALAESKFKDAIAAYEELHRKQPDALLVERLAQAKSLAGDQPGAKAVLAAWLQDHAGDLPIRFRLAGLHLARNELAEAKTQFEELVKLAPNSAAAHNDLAWVLLRQGELPRAMTHASRARELDPRNGFVMDTFGLVLLAQGQSDRAVAVLRDAANLVPHAGDVQYHLALALSKTGNGETARGMLEKLLSEKASFNERQEAEKLLRQLGG